MTRIPRVLATVTRHADKADADGRRAVQDALDRRGLRAEARLVDSAVRLAWTLDPEPSVTVVIPTRHSRALVGRALEGLRATDYHAFEVRVIDSGERSPENDAGTQRVSATSRCASAGGRAVQLLGRQQPRRPAINGRGAGLPERRHRGRGSRPGCAELVGWATQPGVGLAGLQLLDARRRDPARRRGARHGGFADHSFRACGPGTDTLLGSTDLVPQRARGHGRLPCGAPRAVRALGGFDERFLLCGSDVALGLDGRHRRLSQRLLAFDARSATSNRPPAASTSREDFYTSYWRYQPWLRGGDPYFSPSLSLGARIRTARRRRADRGGARRPGRLGGDRVFRQRSDAAESDMLADLAAAEPPTSRGARVSTRERGAGSDVRTVTGLSPTSTARSTAASTPRCGSPTSSPAITGSRTSSSSRSSAPRTLRPLRASPPLFRASPTAPSSFCRRRAERDRRFAAGRRRDRDPVAHRLPGGAHLRRPRAFYLVQDFEPGFYPAGTITRSPRRPTGSASTGSATPSTASASTSDATGARGVVHAGRRPTRLPRRGRPERDAGRRSTVFIYARPGHWRNCWELASLALGELKERLGDDVRIVTAGSWATPDDRLGRGASSIWACSTTAPPASSTAAATSAWR